MMTDRQFVLRAAPVYGVSIIKPRKGAPEILGLYTINGFTWGVIDALTWKAARAQLAAFAAKRAA